MSDIIKLVKEYEKEDIYKAIKLCEESANQDLTLLKELICLYEKSNNYEYALRICYKILEIDELPEIKNFIKNIIDKIKDNDITFEIREICKHYKDWPNYLNLCYKQKDENIDDIILNLIDNNENLYEIGKMCELNNDKLNALIVYENTFIMDEKERNRINSINLSGYEYLYLLERIKIEEEKKIKINKEIKIEEEQSTENTFNLKKIDN